MSDEKKKQEILPPSSPRLPTVSPPAPPSLPSLPSGNAVWGFERQRHERNALTVAASTKWLRAKADQGAAFVELLRQREESYLALLRLQSLPERAAHQYELGRLTRLNELQILKLQHERDEINAKIEVAAAQMRLAQYLPIPEVPAAPPPPVPTGLTAAEVQQILEHVAELSTDTKEHLALLLAGAVQNKRA